MKKLVIFLLLSLMAMPVAEAKRRETAEEIERKTRNYEGWEWGVSGRLGLVFYEMNHTHIKGQDPMTAYKTLVKMGGNAMIGDGYLINNHWRVGFEAGGQFQYNYVAVPIYATGHYFYGTRKNCLFNFVNLGTNVLFDKGLRFGGLGAAGVGVRLQGPESDHKIDIMIGYQTTLFSPRPVLNPPYSFDKSDVSRIALSQSVFIGVSYMF
jgi:hypothetical protein